MRPPADRPIVDIGASRLVEVSRVSRQEEVDPRPSIILHRLLMPGLPSPLEPLLDSADPQARDLGQTLDSFDPKFNGIKP